MDLECLRVDHLETQERLLFQQMRTTLLDVVDDRWRLDLAHPELVIVGVLLRECIVDQLHDSVLCVFDVCLDFPVETTLHQLDYLLVRVVLVLIVGEIVELYLLNLTLGAGRHSTIAD